MKKPEKIPGKSQGRAIGKAVWPNKLKIGFHLSIGEGPEVLFKRVRERNLGSLQIFVSSPRIWKTSFWKTSIVEKFLQERENSGNLPIVVHSRYLVNPASVKSEVREKSIDVLAFEYKMASIIQANYLVLHMGSHPDKNAGLDLMIHGLEAALGKKAGTRPLVLLENTAGEKNDLGGLMLDIGLVRKSVSFPTGVCFDTCHAFQAGYDLRSEQGRRGAMGEILKELGAGGVSVIHLNDSLKPFRSHHDRHAHIGRGEIGADALARFLLEPALRAAVVILETPKDDNDDPVNDFANLQRLREAFLEIE